jgi:ABC-2 type transport system ATP-binding protein
MEVIKVKNLVKKYNGLTAVDHISFSVEKGEIFGFLGPNGAGKTTTINILATLLAPTEGEVYVNNFNILTQKDQVRKSIGLVFQDPSLDERLTAEENLYFHARLYQVPINEYKKRMAEVLALVDLLDRRKDIVKTFSGGMKRRLEIARGLIHHPAILFLDEPTLGLDPQTRAHLWDYILRLKQEKQMTIFMTTHYMNEAEYCDRLVIIDYGKIVAFDTPANLKKAVGGDIIILESPQPQQLKQEIKQKYGLEAKEENGAITIEISNGKTFLPRLFDELETKVTSVSLREPTLDDVFLHLTGRKIRDEEASPLERMRQHRLHHRR